MVVVFIDFDDTLTVSDKLPRHKSLVEELIEEARNHTRLLPFLADFLKKPSELKRSSILWNETIDYLYQSGTSESEILYIREKLDKKILEHERREHDHCKLAEDTELMLRELKTIGYRLVVLTNTSRSELDRLLSKHHIAHYFDDSITRNEVLKLKPDPEGILIIMQKFEEIEFVIVDDLDFGVFAARNAEVYGYTGHVILVNRGRYGEEELARLHTDEVVSSLKEVSDILRKRYLNN